jgi:hypothetical protein
MYTTEWMGTPFKALGLERMASGFLVNTAEECPCGTNSVWELHTVSTLYLNYDTVHYI